MGADISRVRFDPLDDFSGVVLQQGRLLLDGDFNEYVAALDRRLRAETCDLTSFGPDANHQGVAWVPRLTPDGFRVTAAGGALTIGRGRMYVDGLLAENHGIAPLAFDPLLEGLAGTADTPYDKQPYWPVPDALPAGGPHLAYLDVWEREVTSVEDPGLVEVAVGVDTTARTQTVWQVRLLPSVLPTTTTCATDDDDIPGWLDVIRPSAGRLTTGTVTVAVTDDPCELPPSGGYRGLENQTYRVEVHTGGAPGTASFKWSRDNGSVVQPVVEMVSPTVLRLASLGRDDVLNIKTGNWVEILDDRYELGRRPGVMRRVTDDDVTERTITFADPLPADLQPVSAGDAAARHLRVRRWDQSGVVRDGTGAELTDLDDALSTGLIAVPASALTQVVLEHGAAVSFSVAAGGSGVFRAGDHWIFAARTADTSVEALVAAPPDGVHHHYARLGVVSFPDSETDCRRLWPPEPGGGEHDCSCTVCVTTDPNSITLQQAIDQVRATGGTVCLAAGVYDLGPGVTIDQARSVRIRGQGTATVLVARGTAIDVTSSFGLVVENLAVVSGVAGAAAIRMRGVVATTVENVVVLSYNADGASGSAIELSGVAVLLTLRRNILVGRTGIDAAGKGDKLGLLAAGLRIEDNVVVGVRAGIDVGGRSIYMYACRITANDVVGGRSGAIVADGAVRPGGTLEVARNRIVNDADGIVVGCDATVEANVISGAGKPAGDGIVVAESDVPVKPGHVRIVANRVHDRGATAIALRTAVRTFMVKQNVVTQAAGGILVEARGRIEHAAIDNNELLDIAPGEGGGRSAFGILVMHAESVAVAGNTVARVAQQLREADFRAAIAVAAAGDIRISGNAVDDVGPADGFLGLCVGIVGAGPFHHVIAGDNAVRPTAVPRGDGTWHALLIQSIGQGLIGLGPQKAVVETRSGALLVNGAWAAAVAPRREHVTVSANVLEGGGAAPTCLVRAADIVADANHCTHLEGEPRAVVLRAPTMTVSSNRVRGGDSMLILETQENTFAAVGNLAPAGTHLGAVGNGLPGPWQPLNPSVP
jgi:hypothetical protein